MKVNALILLIIVLKEPVNGLVSVHKFLNTVHSVIVSQDTIECCSTIVTLLLLLALRLVKFWQELLK